MREFLSARSWCAVTSCGLEQQVQEQLGGFRISCSDEQATLLVAHLRLVVEKNKVMNLTRIVDAEEAVTLHVVDSLLPLACGEVAEGFGCGGAAGFDGDSGACGSSVHFVDMGTGAGFPGIPLGIMTGASGLLIDSVGKKIAAVSEFVSALGLSALRTLHSRVEDLPSEVMGAQNFVFARAVAQSNVLIEYAAPLLTKGGLLVLEKARPEEIELERAEKAAKICGMKFVSRETFELPFERGHREILLYRKVGKPAIKLPRKVGMAKQSPLGEYNLP